MMRTINLSVSIQVQDDLADRLEEEDGDMANWMILAIETAAELTGGSFGEWFPFEDPSLVNGEPMFGKASARTDGGEMVSTTL